MPLNKSSSGPVIPPLRASSPAVANSPSFRASVQELCQGPFPWMRQLCEARIGWEFGTGQGIYLFIQCIYVCIS